MWVNPAYMVRTGNDAESATKELGHEPNDCSTSDCAEICDDLGDGNGIRAELELIREHCRVKILTTVRLQRRLIVPLALGLEPCKP